MTYKVSHQIFDEHVEIITRGKVRTESEWKCQVSELFNILNGTEVKRVMLDEREMEMPSDVMSHIGIVKFVLNNAAIDVTEYRIALISAKVNMIANLFGEMFANNRGITIKMFTERDDALKWLNG